MGQQQLILLVLSTVIVGIAIVVGIAAFTENSAKSNSDSMMQDAVRVGNDMQAWKKKPAPFGGQASVATPAQVADVSDYTGATWGALGYGAGATYTNLNGDFQITDATNGEITGRNVAEQNEIIVAVTGNTDADIAGTVTCLRGVNPADGTPCTVAAFAAPTP